MGLFGFGTPKTKADWDKEILRLTDELASKKAAYARAKPHLTPASSHNHDWHKAGIEYTKGELAHAKLMRKNAPKG
jgi:hypothetical protein